MSFSEKLKNKTADEVKSKNIRVGMASWVKDSITDLANTEYPVFRFDVF